MRHGRQPPLLKAFAGVVLGVALAAAPSHAVEGPGANALASVPLVELPPGPIYWHLDTYQSRAEADALSGPLSTVAEAFDRVWLFTIAEASWRPAGGVRIATIGPLRLNRDGRRYAASYMQAATSPGFQTDVHQHGGPEALFTLSGEVCVETPEGKLIGRAGGAPLLINGEVPMRLTSVGSGTRSSLVLILHDATQPWKVPATSSWTPKGLCWR